VPEVIARTNVLSDDGSHEHVILAGYTSGHLGTGEPITIGVERLSMLVWLGERFWIKTENGEAEVIAGKCPVCGLEPYFRTSADAEKEQKLLSLPLAG
jgi:hypothetical protein